MVLWNGCVTRIDSMFALEKKKEFVERPHHQAAFKSNPLTPRTKPWVIQSFLTFDSMDRIVKCDNSLESC